MRKKELSALPGGWLPAAVVLLVAISAGPAFAEEPAGVVKNIAGEVTVLRGTETLTARTGLKIVAGDTLKTGPGASLGVLFRDDSVLSLGPGSTFVIKEFVFDPAEGRMGFLGRILRGTVVYLSGLIAKLSPDAVRFETPEATIGIRGTRFAAKVQGQR